MKKIVIKNVNEIIYEHTLKNGLKLYIWPYDLSEEVYMTFTVKYGSIHTKFKDSKKEYNVPNGLAHFLEHIKFNETNDLTAHEYFYKLGSYTNAYTTYDHTSYEVICNNNIKENLEHLIYFVLNPYFTKNMIQKEKGIIIEEAKSTLNDPYNEGYNTLMNNLLINDNRKYLVTGLPEDIKNINLKDITDVFNHFYVPNNMFLTVTGNVNPFEIEKIVDEYFLDYPNIKNKEVEVILPKEEDKVLKTKEEIYTNVTKEKLLLSFKIPKKNYHKYDDIKLKILFNLILSLNFGNTSDFNDYLITNKVVDDIYYMVQIIEDHIIITFESSTSYPLELQNMIKEKILNLDINEKDFNRKIKSVIATLILGYEDATDVNNDIRNDIVKNGKIIDNLNDIISSLTINDCNKIIKGLKKYKSSYVILKPNKK